MRRIRERFGKCSRRGLFAAVLLVIAGALFVSRLLPERIETAVVRRDRAEDWYTEEGIISFGDPLAIAARASGPVKELCVTLNQRVKKGDPLLILDDQDYRFRLQMAEGRVEALKAGLERSRIGQVMTASPEEYVGSLEKDAASAEAAWQAARDTWEASRVLAETGDIAKIELEKAESDMRAAEAAYDQTRRRYEESRRKLEALEGDGLPAGTVSERFYESEKQGIEAQIRAEEAEEGLLSEKIACCRVTAERDGIVTALPARDRSVIAEGETCAVIRETGAPRVEADVLTSVAPYIKAGDPARIRLSLRGKDEAYTGRVREVYGFADQGTSALGLEEYRVHVVVEPDEEIPESLAGYGVHVDFRLFGEEDALLVPAAAVYEEDGGDYVYRVEGGRARAVPVEVRYEAASFTVIGEGLEEGDTIAARADGV